MHHRTRAALVATLLFVGCTCDGEEVAQSATDLPKPPLDQPKSTPEGPAVALPGAAPDDRKKGDTKKTIAESTPDVKVEFPPFNYTPTVTTQTIDYDLDATSSPGNSTQSQVPEQRNRNQSREAKPPLKSHRYLTFKDISERYNRDVYVYKALAVLGPFSWLATVATVITLLFKIHEYYLN